MYSPLSFNSTNYRLLLNLQPVFPGEISFTCLHTNTAAKYWLVELFALPPAAPVPCTDAGSRGGAGRYLGLTFSIRRGEMSKADFLHPTVEGKPEHLGINSLEQDA